MPVHDHRNGGEVERITKVYQAYREVSVQRRWSAANRGNQAVASERQAMARALLEKGGFMPLAVPLRTHYLALLIKP